VHKVGTVVVPNYYLLQWYQHIPTTYCYYNNSTTTAYACA